MSKTFTSRYCMAVAKLIFYRADTITVRLLLAWASLGYAFALIWPLLFGRPPVFDRPAYALIAIVANEWVWAVLFVAHGLGVHWRALDPVERVRWGVAVNVLGLAVWAYTTVAINVVVGSITPDTALEWTLVAATAWALYRTGLRREMVSV